jgi:hypothetical protein
LNNVRDKMYDDMVNKYMRERVLKSKDESPPSVDKLLNISKFAVERGHAVNMSRIDLSMKLVELLHKAHQLAGNSRSDIYAQLESTVMSKIASLLNDIKINDD